MKEKNTYPEVVINVPMKLRYYLDPASIILGSIIVSAVIIYIGSSLK